MTIANSTTAATAMTTMTALASGVTELPTLPPCVLASLRTPLYSVAVPAHEVRVTAETRARPQNTEFQAC
eukprot:13754501-Alexandrium_andersonii.AAC.1